MTKKQGCPWMMHSHCILIQPLLLCLMELHGAAARWTGAVKFCLCHNASSDCGHMQIQFLVETTVVLGQCIG